MTHLGLVRSIGSIPYGILQHITLDDGGHDSAVPSATDKTLVGQVLSGHVGHAVQMFLFAQGLVQVQRFGGQYILRHRLTDQSVHTLHAYGAQHLFAVRLTQTNVPVFQIVDFHGIYLLILITQFRVQKYKIFCKYANN